MHPSRIREYGMKKIVILAFTIVAITFCACTTSWHYRTVEVEGVEDELYGDYFERVFPQSDSLLNRMGVEGWELVSCYPIVETVYPDLGREHIIIQIKTNTRTKSICYVFRKKKGVL